MTAPILEAQHLCFEYAPERAAVRDVTFALHPGTLCALIGSNGSGKSTLVRLLAGILKPSSGDVRLNGESLASTPRILAAQHLAYVPQASAMVFPFTALEVVTTGRSPFRRPFRFEDDHDHECALKALETAGALHLANRPVTALSGGEQQLVMVARALAQEPACLLLDEPSSSLDLKHRSALMRTLVRLRDSLNLAILVVTHDLHLIDSTFDRVIALREGSILTDSAPQAVLTQSVLADVYSDRDIRTRSVDGRTLVWCD